MSDLLSTDAKNHILFTRQWNDLKHTQGRSVGFYVLSLEVPRYDEPWLGMVRRTRGLKHELGGQDQSVQIVYTRRVASWPSLS